MKYKEWDYITAQHNGYIGKIYKDNMFGMEFCNVSVYNNDIEIFHATLDNTKEYTKQDVIEYIKFAIEMIAMSKKEEVKRGKR